MRAKVPHRKNCNLPKLISKRGKRDGYNKIFSIGYENKIGELERIYLWKTAMILKIMIVCRYKKKKGGVCQPYDKVIKVRDETSGR